MAMKLIDTSSKECLKQKMSLYLMNPDIWRDRTERRGSSAWNTATEVCQDTETRFVWLGPQKLNTKYKNEVRNCSVETASSTGYAEARLGCQMDPKLQILIAQKRVFKSSDTLPKPKSGKPQNPLTSACFGGSLCRQTSPMKADQ